MTHQEWPARDYAIGSFIQATVSNQYIEELALQSNDTVLDIGCGNGGYAIKLFKKSPVAAYVGFDASENMLQLAREGARAYPQMSFVQGDWLQMPFQQQFDYIISFWCLQWMSHDIVRAFENIYHALKPQGKFFTLFPTGDDPLMNTYRAIKASKQFSSLSHFMPPVDYDVMQNLEEKLQPLAFRQLVVERCHAQIVLPSLQTFRQFLSGVPFYQGQVPEADIPLLYDAMTAVYQSECERQHAGTLVFAFTVFKVTGSR